MPASDDRVRQLIAQEAADWFVANRGGLDESERPRFTAWLCASPMNVEEYLAVASIAQQLPGARPAEAPSIESLLARAHAEEQSAARRIRPVGMDFWPRHVARNWFRAIVVAGGMLGVVGWLALWVAQRPVAQLPVADRPMTLHTGHGELSEQRLVDHSVLRLDTDSGVTVQYTASSRQVRLVAGRANFEVAHESQRGFEVLAGIATVHALGTNFDVRLDEDATIVTVYTGRVRVARAATAAAAVPVSAGQQLRVEPGTWLAVPEAADTARSGAWMQGQIRFRSEPIAKVAAEFNRYSRRPIRILTPALRKLEISGSFSATDVDAFVLFLRGIEGVQVSVSDTDIRVSRP
jgi:transmembrane sensor